MEEVEAAFRLADDNAATADAVSGAGTLEPTAGALTGTTALERARRRKWLLMRDLYTSLLLTGQLEVQRRHYEDCLGELERAHKRQLREAEQGRSDFSFGPTGL